MDATSRQRARNRRTRMNTSQENLVKDSSSDQSARDAPARSTSFNRRRQRRRQASNEDQEHVNPAYVDDDRSLPTTIEHAHDENDDDDDVNDEDAREEENVRNADRLVSHVTKQHRRVVNEVREKSRPTGKKSEPESDTNQDDLNHQIREQQKTLSKRLQDTTIESDASPVEPLPTLTSTTGERGSERILEKARRARAAATNDNDLQSTLGSTRGLGTGRESRLQRLLRQNDMRIDASHILTARDDDQRTRFDSILVADRDYTEDIEQKQMERQERLMTKKRTEDILLPKEQDDFFIRIWSEETVTTPRPTTTDAALPATTTEALTTDETGRGAAEPQEPESTVLPMEQDPLLPKFGDPQLIEYQRADILLEEEGERNLEDKRLKYVAGVPVPMQQKLGDGVDEPRLLETEGIFVGKKPVVPRKVLFRAEQRIAEESLLEKKEINRWFAPDGTIVSLSDPTKFVPTRPLVDEIYDPALGKEFYKAYKIDDRRGIPSEPVGTGRYRIDIDLGSIVFFHHHLMSMEHVLSVKLRQLHEHYLVRQQHNVVHQLSEKIKALKSAEKNCKTQIDQNKYTKDEALKKELADRLTSYRNEMRQARNQRCNEMRLDRQLLQSLLDTWKNIKEVRRQQRCTNTSVRLIIKQLPGKKGKHYEQMQREIEEEIVDEIGLAEEQYQRRKEAFDAQMKERKLQNIRKKEAKKRLDQRRENLKNNLKDDNEFDPRDVEIVNQPEIPKPEKPEPQTEDEVRASVLARYQNALRPQNEPDIILELNYSEQISKASECSPAERERRSTLASSSNLFVRILINDKVIADSPRIPLNDDFEAPIGQIYPCYVVSAPDIIKIELYDGLTHFGNRLAEIYLPLPESTVTTDNYQLQSLEFSSDVVKRFKPNQTTAVGAGVIVPLPSLSRDEAGVRLLIDGILRVGVAWGVDDGVVLVPTEYAEARAAQNRKLFPGIGHDMGMQAVNMSNMKNLIEWIKKSNLDPYDPDNAFLLNLLKDYTGAQGDTRFQVNNMQYFRLAENEFEDPLNDDATNVDASLRMKLLEARNENLPDFKDCRFVPPYDHLVRRDHTAFRNYMKRLRDNLDFEDMEEYQNRRPTRIDIARRHGEQQLRKMRLQVQARIAVIKNRKTYDQMVIEENIPNIKAFLVLFEKLAIEPNRPLYPVRRAVEQKKVTNVALAANRDVFILVNVLAAGDLPIRKAVLDKAKEYNQSKYKDHPSLLQPYVEIDFQKTIVRTTVADGQNPNWNEELRVPFRPPDNDFEPSSLQRCRDVVHINVFDQFQVDLPISQHQQDQRIHKRIERNWLGSVKIPFSNIYINGRLEGEYRLDVPDPLLGYTTEPLHSGNRSAVKGKSILRLFITMDPLLATPEPIYQSMDSTESRDLLERAARWVDQLNKSFPNRDFKVTASDTTGRPIFIPRFLRPLPLPPLDGIDDGSSAGAGNLEQRLARFVSLIPFLADTISFPGLCDIWETSDQFLKTMAGDDEEHAVLLNNYFRQLNKTSYIAIGSSIYSGPCSFVLTKEPGQRYPTCWSVSDGRNASTLDNWNPIRHIYLLANETNLWANVQEHDMPSRMFFDLDNRKQWKPFFENPGQHNWTSVQPDTLVYERTNIEDVKALESQIREVVRNKIQDWRLPEPTRWNWAFQKRLQDLVQEKEKQWLLDTSSDAADVENGLKEFEDRFHFTGFPLQMPYTNIRAIVDAVYSTKIFEHPTREVEFALGVHIHPYPNNVLAVWVYVAHLSNKN